MKMSKTIKDVIHLNRPGYNTRVTQSIQQYGTGAMVDFPDQTLMASAPWFWKNNVTKIHDPRLQRALDVEYFGMPGTNTDINATKEGVEVACGEGSLLLVKVKPEGKGEMPARDWYNGVKNK